MQRWQPCSPRSMPPWRPCSLKSTRPWRKRCTRFATFRQMERQLAAAYMKGDRQFVDDLLADDWTSISYRGELWTKARVLAMFDGARPPMSKNEIEVDN